MPTREPGRGFGEGLVVMGWEGSEETPEKHSRTVSAAPLDLSIYLLHMKTNHLEGSFGGVKMPALKFHICVAP